MLHRKCSRGFTLVEILIVVVLLGVLASVVIACFNPASTDARRAALSQQLGTLRGQIQLYALQHTEQMPNLTGTDWDPLVAQTTDIAGTVRGPYLPSIPRNPLNEFSGIAVVAADPSFGDAVAGESIGFIYNFNNGFIWGTNKAGDRVYNEGFPQDPNN